MRINRTVKFNPVEIGQSTQVGRVPFVSGFLRLVNSLFLLYSHANVASPRSSDISTPLPCPCFSSHYLEGLSGWCRVSCAPFCDASSYSWSQRDGVVWFLFWTRK